MKNLILIICLITTFQSNGQVYIPYTILDNVLSTVNPAFSGFNERIHSSIGYQYYHNKNNTTTNSYYGNYNIRLKKHHGIGVNFRSGISNSNSFNIISVNYNYQFNFSEFSKLSIGIAPSISLSSAKDYFYNYSNDRINYNEFNANFGVAYKYKNFTIGTAYHQFIANSLNNARPQFSVSFYAKYDFKINDNLHLIPEINLATVGNYSTSGFFSNLNVKLYKKINLGAGFYQHSVGVFQAGYTIKEKINISYSIIHNFQYNNSTSHEIGIKFGIK